MKLFLTLITILSLNSAWALDPGVSCFKIYTEPSETPAFDLPEQPSELPPGFYEPYPSEGPSEGDGPAYLRYINRQISHLRALGIQDAEIAYRLNIRYFSK